MLALTDNAGLLLYLQVTNGVTGQPDAGADGRVEEKCRTAR